MDEKQIWPRIRFAVFLLLAVFVLGTLGYRILYPEETWTRLFFMTAVTLTTVGYNDFLRVEDSEPAMWYTMVMMVLALGVVLYSLTTFTAYLVEGNLRDWWKSHSMRRRMKKMKDHIIVCGLGQTGHNVVREVQKSKTECAVVELDETKLAELRHEFPRCGLVQGDATHDNILIEAGLNRARGLAVALSNDSDNLFVTLSARLLNPDLVIVSRAIETGMREKLNTAGATRIVSPNLLGGRAMALDLLRPRAMLLVESMLHEHPELKLDEIIIPEDSKAHGKTLAELRIPQETGITVIAYGSADGEELAYNLQGSTLIRSGGRLYFFGSARQKESLARLL